jgi:sialic acid synthase SpsE
VFVDRNTASYCVNENISLAQALESLNANKRKMLFTVDNFFRLRGAFTDGDFRRWILKQTTIDLQIPVQKVANAKLVRAYDDEPPGRLAERLGQKIQFLPIVDAADRVVAIASFLDATLTLGKHSLNEDAPVITIAEIGNNHNGSLQRAKELVDAAAAAGADCVKFQMRDLAALYGARGDGNDASEDLGSQYVLDLLRRFQLNDAEFCEIFDYSRERGLTVLCTPFDQVSVDKLADYGMEGYKIASADLTNHELLRYVARLGKPMLVSTGMSTEQEIYEAVKRLRAEVAGFALLHCNSTYPAPFKDINLNYMARLKEIGECLLGYSGHERGYHVAVAAVAKGAKIIEKHFTLDRSLEGNDHKVSLLPHEFRAMIEAIREVEQSLGSNKPRNLSQGELMNRETLGKSLVAAVNVEEGQRLSAEMLSV